MESPKLSDCLSLFLYQLSRGDKLTRAQLREIMWREFGAESGEEQTEMNRLVGLCDTYLVGAKLVSKITMPKNSLEDEFQITPQGIRVAHLYPYPQERLSIGYVRELFGSQILRGAGSDFSESWSEWKFFDYLEALADDYTIFHSVSWRSRNGGSEGEIDFLIVHPDKGILVLEVKGGVIMVRGDGTKSVWYSRKQNSPSQEIKIDPMAQVSRNARELRAWLRHDPRTQHHRYAVFPTLAFPDSEVDVDLRIDIPKEIIIDMRHLDDLRGRIDAIFAYHQAHAIEENKHMDGEDAVKGLRALILPTKSLEPRLSTLFARERRQIDKFTDRQIRLLNILRFHHQATVLGGAGTGKTLIAFEKATQLAQEGQKVLFLGYNKGLVDWAKRALTHKNITVDTFHGLVGKAMVWVGLVDKMDAMSRGEFDKSITQWLIEVTQRLRESDTLLKKHGFDALVVDEGQDFDGAQWEHLVKFLKSPIEGVLYVFADDGQRIFGDVRDSLIRLGEPLFLDENCRTTAHIHQFAQNYSTNPTPHHLGEDDDKPQGKPVQIHEAKTPDEAYRLASELLHWLIDEQGIAAHDIVLLTPMSAKKTTIWGDETQLGDIMVARHIENAPNPARTVLVSTIQSYKGLECAVAILTEMDRCILEKRNQLIYIALTRARHAVYVIGTLPPPVR